MLYNADKKFNYFVKKLNTGCQKSCSKHIENASKQEEYIEYLGKAILPCYEKHKY